MNSKIKADLGGIKTTYVETPAGWRYKIAFDIILLFGLTELKAQISWTDEAVS
jgi:hypothetical protein